MSTKKEVKWKFMKLNGELNRNYKVSNTGVIIKTKGLMPLKQHDMRKKSSLNGTDYKAVSINGLSRRVHRIVCETFHGAAPVGSIHVNHIDERKNNNNATNLQWATPSENRQAYLANNGVVRHPRATIVKVKRLLNKGHTNDFIAQEVKMSDSNVSAIKLGYIHMAVKPLTHDQRELGNC